MKFISIFLVLFVSANLIDGDSTVFNNLCSNMTVQLEWGQRPEWSFDGKRTYFLSSAFANKFQIEASIGRRELITAHFFHGDCHRVFFPANGDLLAESAKFDSDDKRNSRHKFYISIFRTPYKKSAVQSMYCT